MENEHCVYMLRCKDDTLYTGYTNNLSARLEKHRAGKGAKYTRGRGPLLLEAFESYESRGEALREEYRLKQLSKGEKEAWITERKARMDDYEHTEKFRKP
ncbi:GIY-YIG nuclease family protein [Halobacillus sp. ACCC02827]|uniref:GIY-YIG nuclease family protein n=1 Tax=Bacillaceae TaxID=186817 RepID=UPI0003FBE375|nr:MULTISPECIES: GIY-YIG nuclease family protein [Bacillaceae]QHT45095.1 GIY-YIG nuclease family protein [Bacillus sp. SB49]WJE15870.1 GIY-YIG nuclease family protein [Halobacillus sp. ACCC02827]